MNKFIVTILIVFSNSLLLGETTSSSNSRATNKDSSEISTQKIPPIKITPLYAPDIPDIAKPEKRKHSPHVQERTTLQHIHSEGKDILTTTYVSTSPEGLAFLKEQYPDFFERREACIQQPSQAQNSIKPALTRIPEWVLESSIENAPDLLKGILTYLQSYKYSRNKSQQVNIVPSFHRFILEGPPGTGKTTLAYAIAHMLNYPVVFIPATSLLGHFRNETSNNIEKFLQEHTVDGSPKVIIFDELHKLFEHHDNNQADDSQSAAAFWLAIDKIEKYNPNIIIIGTANRVSKLPPEIKSRFSGKIIGMPLLNKNQKIRTFKQSIAHDKSVIIDHSVNNAFIIKMLQQIDGCSLRDVQLIIDSAKMFYYSGPYIIGTELPIVLTCTHFQRALDQLKNESQVLQEGFSEKLYEKIKKFGCVLSAGVNVAILIRASNDLLGTDIVKKIITLKN